MPDAQPSQGPDRLTAFLLFVGLWAALAGFNLWRGLALGVDSHFYLTEAESLAAWLQNGGELHLHEYLGNVYWGYVFILGLCKWLFGPAWGQALLVVQAGFYALAAPFLFLTLRAYCPAAPAAAALVGLNPDALMLLNYVLSDTCFMGLAGAMSCLMLLAAARPCSSAIWLSILFLTPLLYLIRPGSYVWLLSALVFAAYLILTRHEYHRRTLILAGLVICGGLAALPLGAVFLYRPELWPFEALQPILQMLHELQFSKGIVVCGQMGTYLPPPHDYGDYLEMVLVKCAYFFQYWNPVHSPAHTIFRHAYYGLVFGLGLVYLAWRFWAWRTASRRAAALVFFCIMLTWSAVVFHALTVIAYEFRYQQVIMPAWWALAWLGLWRVLRVFGGKGLDGHTGN